MWYRWRHTIIIAVILVLAAALRFWGLRWGLPNSLHSYSYHPDEFLTIGAAGAVLTGFFPRFYNYPSLYIYLAATAVFLGSAYGLAESAADAYLCARVVTALMGIAAVAVTYWAGKQLYDRPATDRPRYVIPDAVPSIDRPGHVVRDAGSPEHVAPNAAAIGILAALIFCIAPLHVQHSHFATVDVPSTLFIAACLGFTGLVLYRGSWRDYLLCGAMAGCAAGTKYNAGIVAFALIAAHFLRESVPHPEPGHHPEPAREHPEPVEGRSRAVKLMTGLGCAILAFIITTPAVIFRWSNFWYGFTYELKHAAQGHGLTFVGTGNGFLFTFTSSLWYGLGPALAILFVISAVYGLMRLDRRALVILAFAVPYYALISLSQVRFARYSLPLFPPAALLIAWMATDLWSRFPKVLRWAWAGLLIGGLAGTLLYTIALDRLFVQEPPQDRAARWIFANIPKGSSIGVFEVPWFYSPPYSKAVGLGTLQQRREALETAPYRFQVFRDSGFWEPFKLDGLRPDWVVFSDYETQDALRLSKNERHHHRFHMEAWLINAEVEGFMHGHARWRATFWDRLSAFGIPLGSTQSLPHDMKYPAPTIWIYERRPHKDLPGPPP